MYKAHINELENLPIGDLEELVLPENSTIIKSVYKSSAEKIKKYDEDKNKPESDSTSPKSSSEKSSEDGDDILSVLNLNPKSDSEKK